MMKPILLIMICAALLFQSLCPPACSQVSGPQPQPGSEAAAQPGPAAPPVSKLKLYLLSAVSALSPGIALLKVVYDFKDDKGLNGGNNWLGSYLWLFWIIAFLGFTLDKIPGVAHIHHFFEYGVIWFLAYIATTFLNADLRPLGSSPIGGAGASPGSSRGNRLGLRRGHHADFEHDRSRPYLYCSQLAAVIIG
jgi:hypothetical protein